MRIGIDATPLLGAHTGIGTYTSELLGELRQGWADNLVATSFTWRGRGVLADLVPDGVEVVSRPAPARMLRADWRRGGLVPVEALCGRVDVFHATNFVLPPTRRAASVVTVHDLAYLRFPHTVSAASLAYRELVPIGLSRADVVLVPSATVAEQVADAYAGVQERIRVTPLGVDAAWFDARPADPDWLRERGITRPYLLAVGTLEPRKNLGALVAAYRQLRRSEREPPDLVIVGGAGWGEVLVTAGLPPEHVHLTGYLERAELRRVVAGADVLAFPSLDEGFGIPPLEALACGVPVVANDIPVLREVLGGAATFCQADDPAAFAVAIGNALTNPPGTVASRREYAAAFTWERCARLTHAAYLEAAARHR